MDEFKSHVYMAWNIPLEVSHHVSMKVLIVCINEAFDENCLYLYLQNRPRVVSVIHQYVLERGFKTAVPCSVCSLCFQLDSSLQEETTFALFWPLSAGHQLNIELVLRFVFKSPRGSVPAYISDFLIPHSASTLLRSSDQLLLSVSCPRSKSRGDGAFFPHPLPDCGTVCSSPLDLPPNVTMFKSQLNRHLFTIALNMKVVDFVLYVCYYLKH